MAADRPVAGKAMAKELGDEMIFVGQRDQTIANVPRGKTGDPAAKPPGVLPVVGHGDDGGKRNWGPVLCLLGALVLLGGPPRVRERVRDGRRDMGFQPFQKSQNPCPSAD